MKLTERAYWTTKIGQYDAGNSTTSIFLSFMSSTRARDPMVSIHRHHLTVYKKNFTEFVCYFITGTYRDIDTRV